MRSSKFFSLLVVLMATLVAGALSAGCATVRAEVCIEHPQYGLVCVQIGDQTFTRNDLTPAQLKDAEAWAAARKKEPE